MKETSEGRPKFTIIPRDGDDEALKLFNPMTQPHVANIPLSPDISDSDPQVIFHQPATDTRTEVIQLAEPSKTAVTLRRYPSRIKRNLRNKEARAARHPKTTEAIIDHMRAGRRVLWEHVEWSEIRGILEQLSIERGVPVSMLDVSDLLRPAELFGRKNLSGFLAYTVKQKRQEESTMPFIKEKTGIEVTTDDIIASIRNGRIIYWDMLPGKAVQEFKERLAQERGTSVAMLSSRDLTDTFELLGGRTARGLVRHQQNLDGSLPVRRGETRSPQDPSPTIDELIQEIKSDRDVK